MRKSPSSFRPQNSEGDFSIALDASSDSAWVPAVDSRWWLVDEPLSSSPVPCARLPDVSLSKRSKAHLSTRADIGVDSTLAPYMDREWLLVDELIPSSLSSTESLPLIPTIRKSPSSFRPKYRSLGVSPDEEESWDDCVREHRSWENAQDRMHIASSNISSKRAANAFIVHLRNK